MLFLTQLFGGTGSDRHPAHARPALPQASPASRRQRALAQRPHGHLFRVIMTHTTPNFDDFQLEIMLKELVNAPRR